MSSVGDMAYLGQQIQIFQPRLLTMLTRRIDPRLRSRIDALDILQETYLEAHRRWKQSHGTVPADSYVWWYGIARDLLIEAWRKHKRSPRDLTREAPLPSRSSVLIAQQLYAAQESPSAAVGKLEQWQMIQNGMQQLKDTDQELLWMRCFDQLSFSEIGAVLKCTEAAARMRYARTINQLKRLTEQDL